MNLGGRKIVDLSFHEYFEYYFEKDKDWKKEGDDIDLEPLQVLVEIIRNSYLEATEEQEIEVFSIEILNDILKNKNTYRKRLAAYLNKILSDKKFSDIISDAGIPVATDFFYEVKEKIFSKFLPHQPKPDTLEYVLNQVFYRSNDADWINKIPEKELNDLFTLMDFKALYHSVEVGSALSQILYAFEILTLRVCGQAMESEVIRMVPEYNNLESPFVAFQNDLSQFEQRILKNEHNFIEEEDIDFNQLKVLLSQCQEYVSKAFKNSGKFGISLRVNQELLRMKRQLNRLEATLHLVVANSEEKLQENSIELGIKLITYHCHKNDLSKFVDEGTLLISKEVTQQTANTGEKYITEDKKGYFKMLKTASGGGLIVGLMCVSKTMLYSLNVSDFGKAFVMSMNYSIGFIVLYLLSFTLATKQPAMTASTLINALEKGLREGGKRKTKHLAFAQLFASVFRSQFIAFVGNVILAFPTAMLVVFLVDLIFSYNISAFKSETLLNDLNIFKSPALFHAGIAGIYLFLSGVIAGVISNRNKFSDFYYRIQEHPFLKRRFGKNAAKKIAGFIEKKWPGIMSNFWFGVFMGSTGAVGTFFGLDLGIRHISFSSGNLALGIYGEDFGVTTSTILMGVLAIGLIGLINFGVSFALSMILAFRSRKIPIKEFVAIFNSVFVYFRRYPTSFFYPIKSVQDIDAEEEAKITS
ncbi:MAG: recombinase [Bacteroidota bacterium]